MKTLELVLINCPCSKEKIQVVIAGGIQSTADIKYCPKCGREKISEREIPANKPTDSYDWRDRF